MTPTIQDQIAALANTISHTEAELERLISDIAAAQWEADQEIKAARNMYEECDRNDDATVKALIRRAQNAKNLAAKIHDMTLKG